MNAGKSGPLFKNTDGIFNKIISPYSEIHKNRT